MMGRLALTSAQTLTVGTHIVMVGLVPTIHLSASSGARGTLDPRDKPEDDSWCQDAGYDRQNGISSSTGLSKPLPPPAARLDVPFVGEA
jgi:hypothetical protein